eukprot:TRINITY_DN358_c0_g2_i6.p1 TRINITY_DN358_c0_g2~~TRINITY_DN358_c0_g2_i6.p1  ORF type:complete len:534 (+),score=101.86 TRINITY_DN358_c0_g2_i6:575-2176(+)
MPTPPADPPTLRSSWASPTWKAVGDHIADLPTRHKLPSDFDGTKKVASPSSAALRPPDIDFVITGEATERRQGPRASPPVRRIGNCSVLRPKAPAIRVDNSGDDEPAPLRAKVQGNSSALRPFKAPVIYVDSGSDDEPAKTQGAIPIYEGCGTPLLDWLPAELLLHLLSFVGIGDLGRLARVCTGLRDLASHDSLWRAQLERIIDPSAAQAKLHGQLWKERCRQYLSPPQYAFRSRIPAQRQVVCQHRLGPDFVGHKSPSTLGLFSTRDDVVLFDAQLKRVGRLHVGGAAHMVAFGNHIVVANHDRLKLLSLEGRTLAVFPFRVPKNPPTDLPNNVAMSSDRLGVLTSGSSWGRLSYKAPSDAPIELLLLDCQLQLVERVAVMTAADIGADSFLFAEVVCVAEQFLVVSNKTFYDDDGGQFRSLTVWSLSSRASRTILLGKAHARRATQTACAQDRLLVCANDLRAFCFSASGMLLWTFDIAGHLHNVLPLDIRNFFLRFDETGIFIQVPIFGVIRLTVDDALSDSHQWTLIP